MSKEGVKRNIAAHDMWMNMAGLSTDIHYMWMDCAKLCGYVEKVCGHPNAC